VLPGVWPQLMFRGGTLQSVANRGKAADAPAAPDVAARALPLAAPAQPAGIALVDVSSASVPASPNTDAAEMPAAAPVPPAAVELTVDPQPHYDVSPSDQTLRATLARWAGKAGWTFNPEHWTP